VDAVDRELAPKLFVQVRKARTSAGHRPFLLDVSLELPAGFTILFGPSGAGKSTLLDCIAGLTSPDIGQVKIGEQMLFDSAAKINLPTHQRGIAYVFQSASLFPHMTVAENIRFGIAHLPENEQQRRLQDVLTAFRVEPLRDRRATEMSGGEAQRVELARSLVTNPHALLLDEPMTALDDELKSQIIDDLLAWEAARNIPIVYVTHSKLEAAALGGKMVMLQNGTVVAG
jgi:molybdate transport system ATP-binding protein